MGLFNFFKRNKIEKEEKGTFVTHYRKLDDEYYNLLSQSPIWDEYVGRDYDYPKYTDKYDTGTDFKLRELLLLVWWGKTKKPRKSDANIPKYFFETYNLDGDWLTHKFRKKKWLHDDWENMNITPEGKEIIERFKELWEIHSLKNYPYCLDEDFPFWNKEEFEIKMYITEVDYYTACMKHHEQVLKYLIKNNIIEGNQQIYHRSEIDNCRNKIKDKSEKLEILKNKWIRKHENLLK